jgi:hypothetical protein
MPQMPDFIPTTHVIKKLSSGVGDCFRGASDSVEAIVDVDTVCSECNLVSRCPGVCLFECGGTFRQQAKQTQQVTKTLYNNNQQQARREPLPSNNNRPFWPPQQTTSDNNNNTPDRTTTTTTTDNNKATHADVSPQLEGSTTTSTTTSLQPFAGPSTKWGLPAGETEWELQAGGTADPSLTLQGQVRHSDPHDHRQAHGQNLRGDPSDGAAVHELGPNRVVGQLPHHGADDGFLVFADEREDTTAADSGQGNGPQRPPDSSSAAQQLCHQLRSQLQERGSREVLRRGAIDF